MADKLIHLDSPVSIDTKLPKAAEATAGDTFSISGVTIAEVFISPANLQAYNLSIGKSTQGNEPALVIESKDNRIRHEVIFSPFPVNEIPKKIHIQNGTAISTLSLNDEKGQYRPINELNAQLHTFIAVMGLSNGHTPKKELETPSSGLPPVKPANPDLKQP